MSISARPALHRNFHRLAWFAMIMTASTMATVRIVRPVPDTGGAKRGNQPMFSVSQMYTGTMAGASTPMPQRP